MYIQDYKSTCTLDKWLRRYLCSSGSCSRDNKLFRLGRINFILLYKYAKIVEPSQIYPLEICSGYVGQAEYRH